MSIKYFTKYRQYCIFQMTKYCNINVKAPRIPHTLRYPNSFIAAWISGGHDSMRVAHRSYYHLSNIQHLGELTLAINKAWLTTRGESVDTRYSRDQHQLGSYEQTLNKSLLCIYITRFDSQPISIRDTDIDHALTPYLWINNELRVHTNVKKIFAKNV